MGWVKGQSKIMKGKIIKALISLCLVATMVMSSFAAVVSDDDASAFVTNILCVKKIRIPIAHRLR